MKKLFSIMFLVMAVTLGANAQLLYKISGNGLKAPSYVIGTYHLADVKFADSIPGLKEALEETSQVYGELRTEDMFNPDSLMKMLSAMMMPEGKKLADLLTADQMTRLNAYMTDLMEVDMNNPMVAQQMGSLTPMTLVTQFQVIMCIKNGNTFDPANSFDDYFQKQAAAEGKPAKGFETFDFQVRTLFQGISLERQAEILMSLVDHKDEYNAVITDMIKAYYAQDLEALKEVLDREDKIEGSSTPEEYEMLIYGRNDNWMKQMPAIMAMKPTFFAVGAAHLIGDRGILAQLRKAGYTVKGMK